MHAFVHCVDFNNRPQEKQKCTELQRATFPSILGLCLVQDYHVDRSAHVQLDRAAQDQLDRATQDQLDRAAQDQLDRIAQDQLNRAAQDQLDRAAQDQLDRAAQDQLGNVTTKDQLYRDRQDLYIHEYKI